MLVKAVCGAKLGAEIFMCGDQQRENVSPKEFVLPTLVSFTTVVWSVENKKRVFVLGCSSAVGSIAKIFINCTKSIQTSLVLALAFYCFIDFFFFKSLNYFLYSGDYVTLVQYLSL